MKIELPPPPESIEANAGGTLTPQQVIGRDDLIRRSWNTLSKQSVVFVAPRRSGKSSVCTRMVAFAPDGFVCSSRTLEGANRAIDLVRMLYDAVSALLQGETQLQTNLHQWATRLFGQVEIAGLKIDLKEAEWRDWLNGIFKELQAFAELEDSLVVLFWDEFPSYIEAISRSGHPSEAMALLDRLRGLRSEHNRVRMVFTGSIGLDEVIGDLREVGYTGDPTNDMKKEVVDVLAESAALLLSRALLKGSMTGDVPEDLVISIAILCEGHPFLMQHVVQGLAYGQAWTASAANEQFERYLESADDPFELCHYIERLSFRTEDPDLAGRVLDAIARSEGGLTVDHLLVTCGGSGRSQVTEILRELRRDRYVQRDGGKFRFHRNFLLRYWKLERGL